MANNMDKTTQRRITFLSLLNSAALFADDPYTQATDYLEAMEADGFFGEEVSPKASSPRQNRRSPRRASNSRQSSSGNGGYRIKDPDAPATKSQIGKLLSLTDEYSWEEAEQFTKGDISNLIEDLV